MLLKALILLSRRRSKSLWGPQPGEKPGDEVDLGGGTRGDCRKRRLCEVRGTIHFGTLQAVIH